MFFVLVKLEPKDEDAEIEILQSLTSRLDDLNDPKAAL